MLINHTLQAKTQEGYSGKTIFVIDFLIIKMQDFEKIGDFYLRRVYDLPNRATSEELLLYDARDLVTHAVCIGMSGSGKTEIR